jgi:hypothetical protein
MRCRTGRCLVSARIIGCLSAERASSSELYIAIGYVMIGLMGVLLTFRNLLSARCLTFFGCIIAGAVLTASQNAAAQIRPVTTAMSCQSASNLVSNRGAVVLSTGTYTFDRYVRSSEFCPIGQSTDPAWVPTADQTQCFVGYRCRGVSQGPSSR